jgi:hypothetical protein
MRKIPGFEFLSKTTISITALLQEEIVLYAYPFSILINFILPSFVPIKIISSCNIEATNEHIIVLF